MRSLAVWMCLFAAAPLGGQELPPGILLLSKIKRHVRQEIDNLPDYTCLQTIRRSHKNATTKGAMKPLDTVRLEVLYSGSKELYGSPGDRDFREDSPASFTGGGMTQTGVFALFLKTLFVHDNGRFLYKGEEVLDGRRAARYDFVVSVMLSGYTIHLSGAAESVGMKGSVWADPETQDVFRLEVNADDIPIGSPVQEVETSVEYARTRIGEADIMLPQRAEVRMVQTSGDESVNSMEFTHCRSFRAESSISFGTPAAASGVAPAQAVAPAKPVMIPEGQLISVTLARAITSADAVGSLIDGKVAANVVVKGETLIPAGAAVHGRIRRLEQAKDDGSYFTIGIEFTEIEWPEGRARFFAELQSVEGGHGIDMVRTRVVSQTVDRATAVPAFRTSQTQLRAADLPGVGTFFADGAVLNVPANLRTIWKTRALR